MQLFELAKPGLWHTQRPIDVAIRSGFSHVIARHMIRIFSVASGYWATANMNYREINDLARCGALRHAREQAALVTDL